MKTWSYMKPESLDSGSTVKTIKMSLKVAYCSCKNSYLHTHRLLPVHALQKVLQLQLALTLCSGLPDAVRTFNQFLLKGMAACRLLVGLLSALKQKPFLQIDTEPRLHVHNRHYANEGREKR